MGQSLAGLLPQTRQLLRLLDERHVTVRARREKKSRGLIRVTQRELREALAWGDFSLRRHLSRLVELEYVLAYRTGARNQREYQLLYDGQGRGGEVLFGAGRYGGVDGVRQLRKRRENQKRAPGRLKRCPFDAASIGLRCPFDPRPQRLNSSHPGHLRPPPSATHRKTNKRSLFDIDTLLSHAAESAPDVLLLFLKGVFHVSIPVLVSVAPVLAEKFYQRLQVRNFAASTIKLRRDYLGQFLQWLDDRGITQIDEVTRDVLLAYQRYFFHLRSRRTGKPLKFSTQISRLIPVRAWFRFLLRERIIAANPASDMDLPEGEQRLPSHVLSADRVERIMNQPDVSSPFGLRDRAMLETLYSTAMRRSELIHLTVYDLDAERRIITIRQGKGGKDRNVPVGQRACLDREVPAGGASRLRGTNRLQRDFLVTQRQAVGAVESIDPGSRLHQVLRRHGAWQLSFISSRGSHFDVGERRGPAQSSDTLGACRSDDDSDLHAHQHQALARRASGDPSGRLASARSTSARSTSAPPRRLLPRRKPNPRNASAGVVLQ